MLRLVGWDRTQFIILRLLRLLLDEHVREHIRRGLGLRRRQEAILKWPGPFFHRRL